MYCPFKRLPLVVYLSSPFIFQSSVADLLLTLAFSFESFCAKYSHTFDRLPFGIFSVKRLMASSVCACLLFTVIRLLL